MKEPTQKSNSTSVSSTMEETLHRVHRLIDAGLPRCQNTDEPLNPDSLSDSSDPNQKNISQNHDKCLSSPDQKESSSQCSTENTIREMAGELKTTPSSTMQKRKNQYLKTKHYHPNEWTELAFYPLLTKQCHALILKNTSTNELRYIILEPSYTATEQTILDETSDHLQQLTIPFQRLPIKKIPEYLTLQIHDFLQHYHLSEKQYEKLFYHFEKEYFGLRIIHPLMLDPSIEEISCDGLQIPIHIDHLHYGILTTELCFTQTCALDRFVLLLAQKTGQHVSYAQPLLHANLPDGSRVQLSYSNQITTNGSSFSIRKKRTHILTTTEILENNTMSAEVLAFLWLAVEHHISTLISGGNSSGKTTTLNLFSLFIPQDLKVVSIEAQQELQPLHPHWISHITRQCTPCIQGNQQTIHLEDLMSSAIQQRPDYLFLGELLGKEAYMLFQAMAVGHCCFATIHAEDARNLIRRLETAPYDIPRIMLQGLDLIVQQVSTRVKNKRVRRVKHIIELVDIDPTTKELLTNEVFRWDPLEDTYQFSGKSYVLEKIRSQRAIGREQMINELRNRARLLRWIQSQNIHDPQRIISILQRYQQNPELYLSTLQERETEVTT